MNKSFSEMIKKVAIADRAVADQTMANAVQQLQAKWIEAGLIADALLEALVKIAHVNHAEKQIARSLRKVANYLEAERHMH